MKESSVGQGRNINVYWVVMGVPQEELSWVDHWCTVLSWNIRVNPDISRVECIHIQGIRAADVVLYLNALITLKMGALGLPEG